MNLVHLLHQQAESRPDATALIQGSASCSYEELDRRSAQGARLLREAGLVPGDVVFVAQPVSIDLYVCLASIFRAGLIAMIPDPTADRSHIRACCLRRPPNAFVGSVKAHMLRLFLSEVRDIPLKFVMGGLPLPGTIRWRTADLEAHDIEPRKDHHPALLTFTSGSTGQPKAAVRSHGLIRHQYEALRDTLELHADERVLSTLPIFVLAHLASGMTSILPEGDPFSNTSALRDQIDQHGPSHLEAPPAVFEQLMESGASFDSVRRITTGGAPVFPRLLRTLHHQAPEAEVQILYGSTEAEPITSQHYSAISDSDWQQMAGQSGLLVGAPCDAVDLRIIRDRSGSSFGRIAGDELAEMEQPTGEIGEIVVTGDHVLKGYLDGMGDAETKFRVDDVVWHRTGDAGYMDDQGRLWLVGRTSTRLDDRKGRLYTLPVMSAAQEVEGVNAAAILTRHGRRILIVESEDSESVDESALKQQLSWAEIDAFKYVDRLPRDRRHRSKIDHPALEAMI